MTRTTWNLDDITGCRNGVWEALKSSRVFGFNPCPSNIGLISLRIQADSGQPVEPLSLHYTTERGYNAVFCTERLFDCDHPSRTWSTHPSSLQGRAARNPLIASPSPIPRTRACTFFTSIRSWIALKAPGKASLQLGLLLGRIRLRDHVPDVG
ncbi:hypothetical protein H4582DRAFT_1964047 [Lactarius indigo]|nr:hypothetical protein H4582DRAFT_1964047 [Lactarius indigo]